MNYCLQLLNKSYTGAPLFYF